MVGGLQMLVMLVFQYARQTIWYGYMPIHSIHHIENSRDSIPSGIAVAKQSRVEGLSRLHGLPLGLLPYKRRVSKTEMLLGAQVDAAVVAQLRQAASAGKPTRCIYEAGNSACQAPLDGCIWLVYGMVGQAVLRRFCSGSFLEVMQAPSAYTIHYTVLYCS